jgi:D,D-heptose 1,7-bisphosphate phosphatase
MSEKAIFLDRDNTIIHDPGYISDPGQVKLCPHTGPALVELKSMGYKLVIVTNQSGIARGYFSEDTLTRIHERLKKLIILQGTTIDAIYYCPYLADGAIPKYRVESDMRKPKPGMILKAADDLNINLKQSWMIGDSQKDVDAGINAGCRTILIDSPDRQRSQNPDASKPDFFAVNLKEAANIIKQNKLNPKPAAAKITTPPTPIDQITQPQPVEPQTPPKTLFPELEKKQPQKSGKNKNEKITPKNNVEALLNSILDQLKTQHRRKNYTEFSILTFLAGILQVAVVFCLLLALLTFVKPTTDQFSVFKILAFALVLQMMALTFYLMKSKR